MKECPHCGVVLVKGRSLPDHNRFFALICAAFQQWPEDHDFEPRDHDHLRKWLLCKAGFFSVKTFELPDGDPVMMARMMEFAETLMENAGDDDRFGRWRGRTLAVFQARSMAFESLGQKEFAEVRTAVEDVIKAETGLDPEALLRERAA